MAGIAGVARPDDERRIQEALEKIAHRGGAGTCARSYDGATLGQVWPPAHEPFAINCDQHAVVLDGEIYNWSDLAHGATCPLESLEKAYRASGPEFVTRLDGPFALAIAGLEGIFLARDVVGKSPLYYGWCDGSMCFASELKALLNWAQDISEFPPGHYYEPGRGLVEYGSLERLPEIELPADEVAAGLRERLTESVRKRVADGETGAWLSGGLDSAGLDFDKENLRRFGGNHGGFDILPHQIVAAQVAGP